MPGRGTTAWARVQAQQAGFYGQYLRLYVLPRFGEFPLDSVSRQEDKQFISDLRARGLSKNAIRWAVTTLRAVLSAAQEDRLIQDNPARGLGRFVKSEEAEREATSLTPHQVESLLGTAENDLSLRGYALILTALRAGLREGELAGVRWMDLHFGEDERASARYLLVQRSYDRRWSRKMLTTKSKKPRRVDMSRELRAVLLKLRAERLSAARLEGKADISEELVFPSEAGTPLEMNNFYARVFKPLVARVGIGKIRFHDLRHTFGSLLIQVGASLAYVRDRMGHSSIQVTVDVYGHLIPGANIGFVDKLDSPRQAQQSAIQPQQSVQDDLGKSQEVLRNQWLGGRDSNPDTQIQSFLQAQADQQNQQLSSADCGGVRPNPQYSRNKEQQAWHRVNGFDSEEDTLP
ncbi:MAG TPA: site-specific integrase [Bryobacteraceae bacterium]|jgi:integrase|nr:site-specific integrase [Bryobacteraceae bacterium]